MLYRWRLVLSGVILGLGLINIAVAQLLPALVKDIYPGTTGSGPSLCDTDSAFVRASHIAIGRLAYFLARDDVNGRELWRSDGREPGTVRLTDFIPEIINSRLVEFNGDDTLRYVAGGACLLALDDLLLLVAEPDLGRELYRFSPVILKTHFDHTEN